MAKKRKIRKVQMRTKLLRVRETSGCMKTREYREMLNKKNTLFYYITFIILCAFMFCGLMNAAKRVRKGLTKTRRSKRIAADVISPTDHLSARTDRVEHRVENRTR